MHLEDSNDDLQISVADWVITIFITSIPMVGFIMLFVWAFGNGAPKSKANWAKAMLLFYLLGVAMLVIFGSTIIALLGAAGNF